MKDKRDIRIGVDIGHGSDTPGKAFGGFNEHWHNSELALLYVREMERRGFSSENFVLAQEPHSKEVQLSSRYDHYDGLDFYLSFHHDAHSDKRINGMSLYHWINSEKGVPLAETFAEVYRAAVMPINFKKVDEADTDPSDGTYDNMGILREPYAPGLLIEHGYMTNDRDRRVMTSPVWKQAVVKLWADASILYLERMGILEKKPETDWEAKYFHLKDKMQQVLDEN